MKPILTTLSLCCLAFICFSFTAPEGGGKDRKVVQPVLMASNLSFAKDVDRTVFSLAADEGDSFRIMCNDCVKHLAKEGDAKGKLSISLESPAGVQVLTADDFNEGWITVKPVQRHTNLVIERDGTGKKNVLVRHLEVFKKTLPAAQN